ncbi:Molybdopterin molybdenumtransferase [hydrothermal vent metagenome]|uniref:Molybdopterin molybdenumtransferase n=1 Tax=hydrothermal vent metagenome TaxID=652676 RepID=A0A3B0TS00_9ZZZZ
MISFKDAYEKVLQQSLDLGDEKVLLQKSMGRVLAEEIFADRDFPPFDRSTKDGIAINYAAIEKGRISFKIEGVLPAGMPQETLQFLENCLEIMTGAVCPKNADTIVMYEQVTIENGIATLLKAPKKGQNIHRKGSDEKEGTVLLKKGGRIDTAEIGVLASMGKAEVLVKKVPKIAVISTGNELVAVSETPLPHQIRKSNTMSLEAALSKQGVFSQQLHLSDEKNKIEEALEKAVQENDVLILSGGVSKGRFDFIPDAMETLGIKKIFHRVAQRPGKPFWFGVHPVQNTVIFAFPGNPISTFANYHLYFLPWLYTTWGLAVESKTVILQEEIKIEPPLTRFIQVKTTWKQGGLCANTLSDNGSGDLTSLSRSDGFICLDPREKSYQKGELVPFVSTKSFLP